jgi:hypothetical protein
LLILNRTEEKRSLQIIIIKWSTVMMREWRLGKGRTRPKITWHLLWTNLRHLQHSNCHLSNLLIMTTCRLKAADSKDFQLWLTSSKAV